MKKLFFTLTLIVLTLPVWAVAQNQQQPHFRSGVVAYQEQRTFKDMVDLLVDLINPLLALLVALAILVFFKGLVSFIAKSGDSKSHAEGRSLMVWGLVGLFVMVSVFGILRFFFSDFGFTNPHNSDSLLPLLPENSP